MIFQLGELFCGPGGLGCGARGARLRAGGEDWGFRHAWATDYHEETCATFRENLGAPGCEVRCADVRQLDFRTLDEADALSFGFPCNDFSNVGERLGVEGQFGPLYTYCVKAVAHFRPRFFLAENVGGLKSANGGETLSTILREFFELGYNVFPHYYRFEKYGVPQMRHRFIIIGIAHDEEIEFRPPAPLGSPPRTSRQALEDPPIPAHAPNQERTRQHAAVVERLQYIRPGENAFTADLPDRLRLNVRGATISQIYRRLDPDRPGYTVTGSGGGGTHIYHWDEPRALTNRERARLQTFPDTFRFLGRKESIRRQIGMAVPPEAARVILTAVLKSFAGVRYPSVECSVPPLTRRLSGAAKLAAV